MPHAPSVEAMMKKDEASRGLGIELVDQDGGRAVTRMTIRADMVNGMPSRTAASSSRWPTPRSPARATVTAR